MSQTGSKDSQLVFEKISKFQIRQMKILKFSNRNIAKENFFIKLNS